MSRQYVPILKCKKGEQNALRNLSESIKDAITPLLEIPFSSAITKKPILETIDSFWDGRKFFFYFLPEWYNEYENLKEFISNNILPVCSRDSAIPTIDLSLIESIDDWTEISKNGIAFRIRNNEFGDIENILNPLFENTDLERSKTDLILDLQHISAENSFAKESMLKAVFTDLDSAADFRSIIISNVSYPKQLPPMEVKKIYRFKRLETEVYALSLKLSKRFKFNYIYSDYGPTDVDQIPFVVGMSPNFKIRYTTFDDYLYIKGLAIKKGGLDIDKVCSLARLLTESSDFSGANYSWGDCSIFNLAQNKSTHSGNLTTWVSYAMNHHITFIVNQI